MGRSCFFRVLLCLIILAALCVSHGFGRQLMETVEVKDSFVQTEKIEEKSRELIEILDYQLDPGPNTNKNAGQVPPPQGR